MMEEVGDDNNGDSTFEFVGDGCDSTPIKEELSSVLPSNTPDSTSSVARTTTSMFSRPATSSVTGLFHNPSSELFPYSVPPAAGDAVHQSHSVLSTPPPPIASVEKGSNPSPYQFYQPVAPPTNLQAQCGYVQHPYVPLGQGSVPSPPHSMTMGYEGNIPQSAFEMPLEDSFVTSTTMPYQESTDKGVWGWFKGNEFLNKVAEKAKNSVDSVITTLDPGMKEIIYSGGDISIVVASTNDTKVSAIREAFQGVFGKATVEGVNSQATSIAPQPVGFSAAAKSAEERINNIRQQGLISDHHILVAVENFLAELIPDKWFDLGCILLRDFNSDLTLQVFTQAVPLDQHFVMQAKDQTPKDYPLAWSGYSVTIGQVIGSALGVHHSEWQQALTGVSRREQLLLAAKALAGLYKAKLRR